MRAFAFAVSAACGSPCATAKAVALNAMHIIDNNRVVIRVVAKRLLLSAYCFLLSAYCLLPTAYCLLLTALWLCLRELNPDPKANLFPFYMPSCFGLLAEP